jgi:zinc protease
VTAINSAITGIYVQGLPEDFYQKFGATVSEITKEDVVRVAKQYIDLEHLAIVIVGDRASIEGALKGTNIAPIRQLDLEGNPRRTDQ